MLCHGVRPVICVRKHVESTVGVTEPIHIDGRHISRLLMHLIFEIEDSVKTHICKRRALNQTRLLRFYIFS